MKLDVLSAVHLIAEARRLITPTTSVVSWRIMSTVMMTVQWNSLKMKRMTGTVNSLLECSLRTTQHVTVLSSLECQPGVRSTSD
jgi:hypothetical protein